jgi:putative toxin-antitoxin system antitoxin component (TIGR02293 family)
MIEVENVARVLGGQAVLGREIVSLMELEEIVSEGLPVEALQHCSDVIYRTRQQRQSFVHKVVPTSTWKRRLQSRTLSVNESEKTERLARVVATAQLVWGDDDDARTFLDTPHPELHGKRPIEAALTELGARRVEDILWAIYYGLPA